jgi:hypothetical protein
MLYFFLRQSAITADILGCICSRQVIVSPYRGPNIAMNIEAIARATNSHSNQLFI